MVLVMVLVVMMAVVGVAAVVTISHCELLPSYMVGATRVAPNLLNVPYGGHYSS